MASKITVIQFRAYDKAAITVFLDKTPEEIHERLKNVCSTYIPTAIMECSDIEYKPLSMLTDLIAQEPDKSLTTITKKEDAPKD